MTKDEQYFMNNSQGAVSSDSNVHFVMLLIETRQHISNFHLLHILHLIDDRRLFAPLQFCN